MGIEGRSAGAAVSVVGALIGCESFGWVSRFDFLRLSLALMSLIGRNRVFVPWLLSWTVSS